MASPPPRSGHLAHRNCSLSYFVEGDGPPVVLIQGIGIGGEGWRPQVDGLEARWRCMCFDNRGFGGSQPFAEAVTVELMARDVLALMDAEGWESAHLAGHSLGGLVALHVARTAPARVRSLALLCTFPSGRIPTRLSAWLVWIGLRMQLGSRRMRRHAFLEVVMPEDVLARANRDELAARLAPLFGHDLADPPPVVRPQLAAMRAYDATPFLNELTGIPTLVVSAAHDRIAPPSGGRTLAAGIAGARFVEIPGASHGVPIQLPEQVNELLHEHWSAAEGQRRT
jgi:pimeloyl-ACP methyl ester carboxylesterase